MGIPSIGLEGDLAFVSVGSFNYEEQWMSFGQPGSEGMGVWVTLEGQRVGEAIDLGASKWSPLVRTEWTRNPAGGVAGATTWIPGRDRRVTRQNEWHRWVVPRPGAGMPMVRRLDTRFVRGEEWGTPSLHGPRFFVGLDAVWSTVWVGGEPVSALTEEESFCPGWSFGTFLVSGDMVARRLRIVDCETNRNRADRLEFRNGAPRLFDAGDGTVGVLLRIEQSRPSPTFPIDPGEDTGMELHLMYARPDGSVEMWPKRIGEAQAGGLSLDDGYLGRVAKVPGGLWLMDRDSRLGKNGCHILRWVSRDGECYEDAPWQLPCASPRREGIIQEGDYQTNWVELVEVPGGAVLVWHQFRNAGLFVDAEDAWEEGLYAVLLTPRGQRGTEVVRVTAAESTGLPEPVGTVPQVAAVMAAHAASEGSRVAVVWQDLCQDAPGV
jgi:hypothetical protein